MAMNQDKAGLYILGIVGIVAAVGVLVTLVNVLGGFGSSDLSGAAISVEDKNTKAPTTTDWTTCLDKGNMIKLGNKEGGTLVKKDVCTGTAGKLIARVSCAQDVDGYYTYKFSNAEQCPQGTDCLKDDNGAAYCG